jgi:hypothetical protein
MRVASCHLASIVENLPILIRRTGHFTFMSEAAVANTFTIQTLRDNAKLEAARRLYGPRFIKIESEMERCSKDVLKRVLAKYAEEHKLEMTRIQKRSKAGLAWFCCQYLQNFPEGLPDLESSPRNEARMHRNPPALAMINQPPPPPAGVDDTSFLPEDDSRDGGDDFGDFNFGWFWQE